MSKIPKIGEVMTKSPHSIGIDQPITLGTEMMKEYSFRHLPVQDGGRLVGVLSQRDLAVAYALDKDLLVSDVYMPEPFTVSENEPLDKVLEAMARESLGCVLVTERDRLLGIFTTVDACKHYAKKLQDS